MMELLVPLKFEYVIFCQNRVSSSKLDLFQGNVLSTDFSFQLCFLTKGNRKNCYTNSDMKQKKATSVHTFFTLHENRFSV